MDSVNAPVSSKIIDIGGSKLHEYYVEALQASFFRKRTGVGHYVPDLFTFSDPGMNLWSDVINLPAWYQTREEVALLKQWSSEIVKYIVPGAALMDLGSGDTSKIEPLLDCIEALKIPITYYSIDLSRASIVRGLERLGSQYKYITLVGLWGSFDNAKQYLPDIQDKYSSCFLACLGAEIGNDPFDAAVADLSSWSSIMRPEDFFLIGVDSTQDKTKICSAYHDSAGLFHRFVRTGMHHTNTIVGHKWYNDDDWEIGCVVHNDPLLHRFVLTALRDVKCPQAGISFAEGEKIFTYDSHRNTPAQMRRIFKSSGFEETADWKSPLGDNYEYLLKIEAHPCQN